MVFRTASVEQSANNFIRAYDLQTGLFKWEVGGKTQSDTQPDGKGNSLAGYYFLGAPLVLGNRTYVLAQRSEEIFLLQIAEPAATGGAPANPRVVRSQLLTQPEFKAGEHPVRKHAGLMPSYAHGLLICPTCDERIVAVSADDNAVRWVFRYAANIRQQELGGDAPVFFGARDSWDSVRVDLDSRWTDSLPRIAGNNVIVTPRDSAQLFCLDLQTGQERWKLGRSQFHSIAAIVDDKIILCGNRVVQAFRLDDGQPLWSQTIGDGIVCGLPATDGALLQIPTSEPAIVSLDVQTGRRLVTQRLPEPGHNAADSREIQIPGNLLIIGNQVLSQNLDSVRAYSWRHRPAGAGIKGCFHADRISQSSDRRADRITEDRLYGQSRVDRTHPGTDQSGGRRASGRGGAASDAGNESPRRRVAAGTTEASITAPTVGIESTGCQRPERKRFRQC
jgi:outer membrane protein assembly factor BamB